MKRLRLALWLAWAAMRGRTVDIEAGTPSGTYRYVGVERR